MKPRQLKTGAEFSDESNLQQFVKYKRNVKRTSGKRFDTKYTIQMKIIWGGMSKSGTSGLYFLLPETMVSCARKTGTVYAHSLVHKIYE